MITPAEFLAELAGQYRQSELDDIFHEREREITRRPEIRRLPRFRPSLRTRYRMMPVPLPLVPFSVARMAGPLGPLVLALREGLTVRGWYNLSVASSVTLNSGNVSALADLHTSANGYAQGTAADQPAYTANDGTLRGRGTMTGDGATDNLQCTTYSTPAPGTTNVYIWAVMKSVTYTAGRNFWNSNSATIACSLSQNPGPDPSIRMNNGAAANANNGLATGSWGLVEELFTNSASDYLRLRSTVTTGVGAGNNSAGTGRRIFSGAGAAPASLVNAAMACLMSCEGNPGAATSNFRTFRDWWITNYFGAGLV